MMIGSGVVGRVFTFSPYQMILKTCPRNASGSLHRMREPSSSIHLCSMVFYSASVQLQPSYKLQRSCKLTQSQPGRLDFVSAGNDLRRSIMRFVNHSNHLCFTSMNFSSSGRRLVDSNYAHSPNGRWSISLVLM